MATTPYYASVAAFAVDSIMTDTDIAALESKYPGYLMGKIVIHSSRVNARLAKRYATPFTSPIPETILDWVERMTSRDAFLKRGYNMGSEQDKEIKLRADEAEAELKEAADAKDGLFDLPLRNSPDVSGVVNGGVLSYSEASPYVWTDQQACTGSNEDSASRGTS